MNNYQEKIARILRTDKQVIENLERQMEKATGKVGILKALTEENEKLLSERMNFLGLNRNCAASEIYDALISKIEADDVALLNYIGLTRQDSSLAAQKIVDFVKRLHPPTKGLFLKKEYMSLYSSVYLKSGLINVLSLNGIKYNCFSLFICYEFHVLIESS